MAESGHNLDEFRGSQVGNFKTNVQNVCLRPKVDIRNFNKIIMFNIINKRALLYGIGVYVLVYVILSGVLILAEFTQTQHDLFSEPSLFLQLILVASILKSATGGFVAGYIAKNKGLLHGLLVGLVVGLAITIITIITHGLQSELISEVAKSYLIKGILFAAISGGLGQVYVNRKL